ncbi:MAG: acetyl-CoA carboxylase carboxyltransferase subunit alpha [Acidobacteria bacterium]|nr:acetyl-CoA carboxylase carboxyltransferase subunit alpha [Acidobacteriota bacterium]MBK9708875.1 acetyl-CoA carboxylase carboxyltransferase subunit alpha [Acidobacteriota bacterium]
MDLVNPTPANMEAINRVQLARHDKRPYALDFIKLLFTEFHELHGDRKFFDDPAIIAGMARFKGRPVAIVAHQKGRDIKERQARNFGMPKPDGYRKALRVMKLAEKFGRPILTFIDTPGAYPGIDAEERGQAEAIAVNLREMARITVPIIVTITGEGGSGGALAIGVGDVVNILENGVYSVITPEGCAAILWKDAAMAPQAAASLKVTARDLLLHGIVDEIIPEPEGGAHENWEMAAEIIGGYLERSLAESDKLSVKERLEKRYLKFRKMGAFERV